MKLIADSGSTKTEWCIADGGKSIERILTAGSNPYFQSGEEIQNELKTHLFPKLKNYSFDEVWFYGAGCAFPDKNKVIRIILEEELKATTEVHSDLIGAARALCGKIPGVACILGTGSNTCLWDGKRIVEHIPSLGYILGDEGSGAVLGRNLINACLKQQLPHELSEKFLTEFSLDTPLILENVYRKPFPNRFLARMTTFLSKHIAEPAIYKLVYDSFRSFYMLNVSNYTDIGTYPIHFVGSIAYVFRDVLRSAAESCNLHVGVVKQSPMEGLIHYHK